MKQRYRPVDGLITRIVDDQLVLVAPTSGTIRVLNEVGTTVWQALQEGHSIEDIVDEVVATHDVSREQARADVDRFLDDLQRRKLLT